jgi:hypothetical protein
MNRVKALYSGLAPRSANGSQILWKVSPPAADGLRNPIRDLAGLNIQPGSQSVHRWWLVSLQPAQEVMRKSRICNPIAHSWLEVFRSVTTC